MRPTPRPVPVVLALAAVIGVGLAAPTFAQTPPAAPRPATAPDSTPSTRAADTVDDPTFGTIRPSDQIVVTIFGLEMPAGTSTLERRVGPDGTVALPLLAGPLKIAGLDARAAEKAVVDAYHDASVIRRQTASVTVRRVGVEAADAERAARAAATRTADDPIVAGERVSVTVVDLSAAGRPMTITRRVGASGTFSVPGGGNVSINGLTPDQAEMTIAKVIQANNQRLAGAGSPTARTLVIVTRPDAGESVDVGGPTVAD